MSFIIQDLSSDKGEVKNARRIGATQPLITADGMLIGDGDGNVRAAGKDDFVLLGDPYIGVDLTQKYSMEIGLYSDEWAWIKARIQSGNFAGIHVADYIPVVANGDTYKARIMGINTYKEYGDIVVGNHIDWIFDELWPGSRAVNLINNNNGLIPVESVIADGTSTTFVLEKEMNSISKIEMNNAELSGWTYDESTYTITFETAPASGTMTVTGTGTEFPWLASDAYHFVNSLSGQVASADNGVKHVDYTQSGIYYYFPQKLKDVIIPKRFYAPKRYSTSGVLSSTNDAGFTDLGNVWFLSETEVYGQSIRSTSNYDSSGSVQYPYFSYSMNRVKKQGANRRGYWLMAPANGSSASWCCVTSSGFAISYVSSYAYMYYHVCFRVA